MPDEVRSNATRTDEEIAREAIRIAMHGYATPPSASTSAQSPPRRVTPPPPVDDDGYRARELALEMRRRDRDIER